MKSKTGLNINDQILKLAFHSETIYSFDYSTEKSMPQKDFVAYFTSNEIPTKDIKSERV